MTATNAKNGPELSRRAAIHVSGKGALTLLSGLSLQAGLACHVSSDKNIRIAVVGGGFGCQFFWDRHPNCTVVGVTDLRPDRRKKLQKTYHCDVAYDSLEEMIERAKDIDAVAVFSGALDHVKHATMCMNRGWHVISAVPACCSLDEADLLVETANRTGLSYMMAETSWYREDCILARELWRKGLLGNVFYTESEYYHDRGDLDLLASDRSTRHFMPDGSQSWRWGFPPMLYPTHCTGFLTGVTGESVVRVSCLGWGSGDHPFLTDNQYKNPFWNECAVMQTNRGNMHRCNVFWLCAAAGVRAQWFGDKATLSLARSGVHDTKLQFRTDADRPLEDNVPVDDNGEVQIPIYWKSGMLPEPMRLASNHGNSHAFVSAEFINSLVAERPPEIDIYHSLAMTVPGIVAHQSALKNGEQLSVPQFERPQA